MRDELRNKRAREQTIRWTLLAAAIVFIAVGVLHAEHLEVLVKAVRVCLECIGIA